VTAYYNEFDGFKAEWLRQLVAQNLIAPGDVDERSIVDVRADDLRGYDQCHFFAGIGAWSYALRQAGWPDDRPVWTGSCPCPSFSAAGKGEGFADARHLWPEWYRLIRECRPPVCFGEQVAAAIGHGWLDLVCGDMEAEGYAVAAAVLGAHSAGAPHIRQRLYFCSIPMHAQRGPLNEHGEDGCDRQDSGRKEARGLTGTRGEVCNGNDAKLPRLEGHFGNVREWRGPGWLDPITARSVAETGATRGFWSDCDWWYGRDEKFRPIGPGLFPLATRATSRVGRLRGYGDSLTAPTAQVFIEAYIEREK
jgi:DNA (cytosine-5)-methyltransferase 1